MKVKLLLMSLLVAVGVIGFAPKANAAGPTAEDACRAKEPYAAMVKVYAEWDYINTEYVRAACWMKKLVNHPTRPFIANCTYWVKYYVATNVFTGPWDKTCRIEYI